MNRLLAETGGDLSAINKRLVVNWSEPLYRIDVHDPLQHNARLPMGIESGADPTSFRWGGYTSGGMPEVIINPIPKGGYTASPI